MANQWFRMYSEFATDPKVQMLSESNQRRLTMLFCFRCNGNVTLHDDEVTFMLRISNDEWLTTKALFIAKGFINSDNEILNWDKRQFVSDSSAERVAKHRAAKKQSIKSDVTQCNVTVTPPEQNRTDTEQIQKQAESNSVENCNSEEVRKETPRAIASNYGLAAKALIEVGMSTLNQSNPTFIALVDAGATPQEFVDAYLEQKSKNKKSDFNYILAMVSGRREDAAQLNLHKGAMPNAPPKSINQKRSETAAEMFKMFKKDNENGRIIDVSDSTNQTDRPLISAHG